MRTATTLVGLTLFALAGTARAQEAAPAATTAAPPAGEAAALAPPPAAATPAPPTESVAAATATPPAQPAASRRKLQLGLSFLPMALGRFTATPGGLPPQTADAAFAYGAAVSGAYEILPGLLLGLAPQLTFNVKAKTDSQAAKQLDVLARVAYAYQPVDTISVYAEVLPGYSLIIPPTSATVPRGFVLAFGAGAAMDLTDRFFANVGVGYQMGFQNRVEKAGSFETRTKYVRVALGGGVKF